MVMVWRPPPEAMRASKPSVLISARKASKGTTYSRALVSGTSRPSSRAWMRTVFTPSTLAWATIALRWSMWLCTLPSENRPMKWITPRPVLAPATICFHASPARWRRRRSRWPPARRPGHTPGRRRWRCGRLRVAHVVIRRHADRGAVGAQRDVRAFGEELVEGRLAGGGDGAAGVVLGMP